MRKAVFVILASLLLSGQTPVLPGFPPGTFDNTNAVTSKTGSSCTINSVSLSNNSFTGGYPSGTVVGAITVSTTGTCGSDALTLSGTNAADFQISGTNLETNGVIAIGSYSINIVATISGASGSPYAQAETISGIYNGPGDIASGWSAWYGMRPFSNALANAGASTVRVADVYGATSAKYCTLFLKGDGSGNVDTSTSGLGGAGSQCVGGLTTFCYSTNSGCYLTKWYDQTQGLACTSGTTCDIAAAEPAITYERPANCPTYPNSSTTIPCIASANISGGLVSANTFTPNGSAEVSLSTVAIRTSGTGLTGLIVQTAGKNALSASATSGDWELQYNNTIGPLTAAAEDAWHAANGVMQAGTNADILNVDGTEAAATGTPATTAADIKVGTAPSSTTVYLAEGGFLDNYVASQSIRSQLCANQAAFYGMTPGTHCNPGGT